MVFFGWKWVSSNLSAGCYHSRPPKLRYQRPKTSGSFFRLFTFAWNPLTFGVWNLGYGFGGMNFGVLYLFFLLEFGFFDLHIQTPKLKTIQIPNSKILVVIFGRSKMLWAPWDLKCFRTIIDLARGGAWGYHSRPCSSWGYRFGAFCVAILPPHFSQVSFLRRYAIAVFCEGLAHRCSPIAIWYVRVNFAE